MIRYSFLGTNNLERARAFYSELLGAMGAGVAMEGDYFTLYSAGENQPMLGVVTPFDKNPAVASNGGMVALQAGSNEQVDALYALALSLGATDEGAPGERMPGFYMAYFRDLDGNKLALSHF